MNGLAALGAAVREGRVSAESLVAESLGRIERFDGPINAVVRTRGDGAFADAVAVDARIEAGDDPGPLAGLPLARSAYGRAVRGTCHLSLAHGGAVGPRAVRSVGAVGADHFVASHRHPRIAIDFARRADLPRSMLLHGHAPFDQSTVAPGRMI